jgi:hypothetical protein
VSWRLGHRGRRCLLRTLPHRCNNNSTPVRDTTRRQLNPHPTLPNPTSALHFETTLESHSAKGALQSAESDTNLCALSGEPLGDPPQCHLPQTVTRLTIPSKSDH